ncbi:MAG: hypothetical protein IIV07_02830, partial [Treponema sp.]|nr:hypothetical protein [Treponema sp.]
MSTFEEFPNQEETMFLSSEEIPNPESTENSELDELNNKISELSKRGYQLLKENDVENAINSFKEILALKENNNYALVGLGDSERKRNNLYDAIKYYNECLTYHP